MGLLDHGKPADARSDVHADAFGVLLGDLDSGVANGLDRRRRAVMDECVQAAGFLHRQVLGDIEPLHLAGDLGCVRAGVEATDAGDAAAASQNVVPRLLHLEADRTDDAEAGDYYSALGQGGTVDGLTA